MRLSRAVEETGRGQGRTVGKMQLCKGMVGNDSRFCASRLPPAKNVVARVSTTSRHQMSTASRSQQERAPGKLQNFPPGHHRHPHLTTRAEHHDAQPQNQPTLCCPRQSRLTSPSGELQQSNGMTDLPKQTKTRNSNMADNVNGTPASQPRLG